jgi:hypothetical protein
MKYFVIVFFLVGFVTSNVFAQKNKRGAHYSYEVSCLGSEMDGSVTVESYGTGRHYVDATEQAKKNALQAVIFKGIKIGIGGCNNSPIIFSANAARKYEDYFADFFKDGGSYLDFVSVKDERVRNKVKRNAKKSKQMQQRMVVVRVDSLSLKKRLAADGIN